jgi:hypothetical protein
MNDEPQETLIDNVFADHQEALMSIPGVVGVGIGEIANSPANVVMLRESTPELMAKLPTRLGGFPCP